MSKKSQKTQKTSIVKVLVTVCVLLVVSIFGGTQVDWTSVLEGGPDAVIEIVEQLLGGTVIETDDEDGVDNSDKQTSSGKGQNTTVSEHRYLKDVDGNFEIYSFYVGQADCTLVICDGKYMLIDAGNNPDGKLIVEQLKSMEIKKIDYLICTHAHEDHAGGVDDVIKNFAVGKFYIPDSDYTSATYTAVKDAAKNKNLKRTSPKVGHTFKLGSATCEIMAIDEKNEDPNLTSIVVEVTYGEHKFLFMGDAEIPNEETRLWNDVDVLKLGHHGSSTSSSEDFMQQVMPEVGLISAGVDNSYGHPHDEIIDLLVEYNFDFYRTDMEGTIHLVSNGSEYGIEILDINLEGNTN